MDKLPIDILFNIFSRLPIKFLLQLRCVAKLWRNIIDHPCLARMHLTRVNEEESIALLLPDSTRKRIKASLHLVKEEERTLVANKIPTLEFELDGSFVEGSCNGLIYFAAQKNNRVGVIVVSNPLKRQYCTIETPHLSSSKTYGLGFDSSTNSFKIVCFYYLSSYSFGTTVHVLGKSSWNEISKVPPYPIRGRPVFARGFLYWMVSPFFRYEKLEGMIISFDVTKEEFNLTPHPEFCSKNCDLFRLVDLKGDLGMVDLSSDKKIDIWVMKDYENKEWIREYSIDIRAPDGKYDNGHIEVIGVWKHGEILLKSTEGYFIYNPNSTTGLRYTHNSGLNPDSTVYIHQGSLISISNVMAV